MGPSGRFVPAISDFAVLKSILDTYGAKGAALVCVNLDNTAEEAATVDQISHGRLDFGVGRSGFPRAYQGYGPTDSYSARYGSNATASTAASNNGASSTSVEAQRQKIYNQYQ